MTIRKEDEHYLGYPSKGIKSHKKKTKEAALPSGTGKIVIGVSKALLQSNLSFGNIPELITKG